MYEAKEELKYCKKLKKSLNEVFTILLFGNFCLKCCKQIIT